MNNLNSVLEESIRLHEKEFGKERAREQASSAGITLSEKGQIVHVSGNPLIVLLRLTRQFILDGKLAKLQSCLPLLAEMEKLAAQPEYAEIAQLSQPLGLSIAPPLSMKRKLEARVKP